MSEQVLKENIETLKSNLEAISKSNDALRNQVASSEKEKFVVKQERDIYKTALEDTKSEYLNQLTKIEKMARESEHAYKKTIKAYDTELQTQMHANKTLMIEINKIRDAVSEYNKDRNNSWFSKFFKIKLFA
jgi:replicative DNA helicase